MNRKAILKVGYSATFYGNAKDVMEVADALERLTQVYFKYDEERSYFVPAKSDVELEFTKYPLDEEANE